jgi:hypothetical protein
MSSFVGRRLPRHLTPVSFLLEAGRAPAAFILYIFGKFSAVQAGSFCFRGYIDGWGRGESFLKIKKETAARQRGSYFSEKKSASSMENVEPLQLQNVFM